MIQNLPVKLREFNNKFSIYANKKRRKLINILQKYINLIKFILQRLRASKFLLNAKILNVSLSLVDCRINI